MTEINLEKKMFDTLGDRLKAVEQSEAGRKAVKGMPLMARLDGRAFHTFTRGLARPYDERLSNLMINTTAFLVEQTHALVGYTQSDEISLCWYVDTFEDGQYLFDGKFQKLTSVLASLATTYFTKHLNVLPEKEHLYPTFDCRVWQVEDLNDAYLNFLWRQDDAVKNAISMAAQAHFSSRKLHGINGEMKKQMLADIGKPFDANPMFFRYGTFVKRVTEAVELNKEQLEKIPEKYRPTGPVMRSVTKPLTLGALRDYPNAVELLFGKQREKNFIEMCLSGEAVAEDIDTFVGLWHESEAGHGQTLSEYLGMHLDEYSRWVLDGNALFDILQERLSMNHRVEEAAQILDQYGYDLPTKAV